MCQRPLTRLLSTSLTILAPPLACSLRHNKIGAQGASTLAAVLKETKISNLEYAAAPKVLAFVLAPADITKKSEHPCVPTGSTTTILGQKAERRSRRASKATQPCSRWGRLRNTRT